MSVICDIYYYLFSRLFQITWISLVIYSFSNTFIYYLTSPQFCYLRAILGSGLCFSRGTASVINLSCALVLLPMCKRLNRIVYRLLSRHCPSVFFFWLENAKRFHMTVAATIVIFGVIHSISHFVNLWNFSRHYDEEMVDINFAAYKNQSPLSLLLSQAGVTGLCLLVILLLLAASSSRLVRRRHYNVFWYTHQLYLPFLVLLIVHPLSGVLKEQVMPYGASPTCHNMDGVKEPPIFVAIKSKTWLWMALPLSCFFVDLVWRTCSRNLAVVNILEARHMAGRALELRVRCPAALAVSAGQYVLLQCTQLSALQWHPFTVVKLPTSTERSFLVWVRVGGDWTRALESLLLEQGPTAVTLLVDGPYCSPLQNTARARVALCVAAGVGVTPFVPLLRDLYENPNNRLPKRVHFIWIVKSEVELTWIADLISKTMHQLINFNKPDRLQLELYVTNPDRDSVDHIVIMKGGAVKNMAIKHSHLKEEEKALLTPVMQRDDKKLGYVEEFRIAERYPLLGCRVKRGRPHWDRLFGYWAHLYPDEKLSLFCCGPKKLVKELRSQSQRISRTSSTTIEFVHEGFS